MPLVRLWPERKGQELIHKHTGQNAKAHYERKRKHALKPKGEKEDFRPPFRFAPDDWLYISGVHVISADN